MDGMEARQEYVDMPHVKKEERVKAMNYWRHSALLGDAERLTKGYVEYSCKKDEVLPIGKYMRAIASLGAEGTISGAYLIDSVKDCFKEVFRYGGGSAKFVVPESDNLLKMYQDFVYSTELVHFVYFSDDSIVNIRCADGHFMGNVDISACDGSNYDPVFDFLRETFDAGDDWDSMFRQLSSVCRVSSYDRGTKHKVYLKPDGQVMYSGSPLTTVVNNMANIGIFLSICNAITENTRKEDCAGIIREAACKVGYDVKVIVCDHIEEVQFLKCSPSVTGGALTVFMNLGVLLRSFGMCKGDLPGTGDWVERANAFNSGRVRGFIGAGLNPVTEAFVNRWGVLADIPDNVKQELMWKGESYGYTQAEGLARRYRVTEADVLELAEVCRWIDLEEIYSSWVIDRIMEIDYGYDPAQRLVSVSPAIDTSFTPFLAS